MSECLELHKFPDGRYGTRIDPVKCENCDFIFIWCPRCSQKRIVGHQHKNFEDFKDFEKCHLSYDLYIEMQDPQKEANVLDSLFKYFSEEILKRNN